MAGKPPPPPVKSEPGSFAWMDWYKKLYDYLNTAGSIIWSSINFAGSNITDIALRLHSSLQGILGTGAYHVSATEGTLLTSLLASGHAALSNILGTGSYHISSAEASLVTLLSSATGTGNFVRATSPTLVTPILGTPSSGIATNLTGLPLTTGVTGILPVANGGTGLSSAGPAFSAYQSSAQSIPNATATKLSFQTEEFDTANAFDSTTNYRFNPQTSGYYQVSGGCFLGTTSGTLFLEIRKNGSALKRLSHDGSGSAGGCFGSALVSLNGSTDYIELFIYQSSGASVSIPFAQLDLVYFQAFLARAV